MASQSLISAVNSYDNYIQRKGIDEQVIDAYIEACRVAINGEKDITYGLQITNRSKGIVERFCMERTGGTIWDLEKYSFANKTHYSLTDKFYDVLLLEAQNKVVDSAYRYLEKKREPRERFYMPRRKQFLKIGLMDAIQGMIDDKYDILCVSLIPGAGKTTVEKMLNALVAGWFPRDFNLFYSHSGDITRMYYDGVYDICTNSDEYTWNESAKRATKSTFSLAAAFGRFYATYFLVIRGIKSLWKSIEGTTDYIEAFNYYTVAFNKVGKEGGKDFEKFGYDNAEDYAQSFGNRVNELLGKMSGLKVDVDGGLISESGMKNLGLNLQEITQYASQLASITNSLGQTGEVTTAISKSMTMLAGDISSLFNVDYSTVATNLQSGLIGQSRALYKYGIDITNATLQTYAYKYGIEKAVSEMSQAEKQQLRLLAILDQSKVSWGDLANTINSPSNMIRQFTNNVKEAGMVLGQLFIPVLQKVLPVINGVVIAIKRLLVSVANLLGIKIDFSSFGQGVSGYNEELEGTADALDKVGKSGHIPTLMVQNALVMDS